MELLQSDEFAIAKPSISIIVPIYNSEKYIVRCIDSLILAAAGHNIELVLVDDGSTDSSADTAQGYCNSLCWIKLISQENKGPSAARNTGLDCVQGKYTGFVDCDDCVSEDYFLKLLSACVSNPDIVVFGYQKIFLDGNKQTLTPDPKNHFGEQESLLCNVNNDRELFWFPWTKIFRSDLITSIRFDESLHLGEDTIFNLHAVVNARIILRIDAIIYFQYEVSGSLSSNVYKHNLLENMEKHFSSRLAVNEKTNRGLDNEVWSDIYNYYIFHILPWLFSNSMHLDEKQQLKELKKIRKSDFVKKCYAQKYDFSKRPRIILIQALFRGRLLRLLQRYLITLFSSQK